MCSDSASKALVASSRRRIFGFRTRARAMAILCFWPPLSCTPRSPTSVSYCRGILRMKSSQLESLATRSISSCVGSRSVPSNPYMILRLIERANRVGSCWTIEMWWLSHRGEYSWTSTLSSITLPDDCEYRFCTSEMMLLLPPPDGPTSATIDPGGTDSDMPFKTRLLGRAG
mmetsp:Transcript_23973/g.56520  ORF Transcript_23973/g.56520 Transcript_23973/m.56520 type:complete len:172 (-) Transcript_23973:1243-1758(-)